MRSLLNRSQVIDGPADRVSYNIQEAAVVVGLSVWCLRRAIHHGQLRVVTTRPFVILRSELEAWLAAGAKKEAP